MTTTQNEVTGRKGGSSRRRRLQHASVTLSQDAIEKTTKLVEFLAEVTAAVERDPVCKWCGQGSAYPVSSASRPARLSSRSASAASPASSAARARMRDTRISIGW